jgi:adenylate kinase
MGEGTHERALRDPLEREAALFYDRHMRTEPGAIDALSSAVRGKRILLIGPPGCGKGNRSRDLQELGLVHVATGIALRERVRRDPDSDLSSRARELMERGELVTDDIIVPIVMEHIGRPECQERGYVMDGFPRTKAQADVLLSQVKLDLVLHLDVPRRFLVYGIVEGKRRACVDCKKGYSDFDPPEVEGTCDVCGGGIVRRADDSAETIGSRLQLYDRQTNVFLPDLEASVPVRKLPITVESDESPDEKYLKKLRGEVYWVETDDGGRARMLNLAGMRARLHELLAATFM